MKRLLKIYFTGMPLFMALMFLLFLPQRLSAYEIGDYSASYRTETYPCADNMSGIPINHYIVPDSVTWVRLGSKYCLSVTFLSPVPPEIEFYDVYMFGNSQTIVYVPEEAVEIYRQKLVGQHVMAIGHELEKEFTVETPGSLQSLITMEDRIEITSVTLHGKLNGSDIKALTRLYNLMKLDLSDVEIVEGGSYYYIDPNTNEYYYTKNNSISEGFGAAMPCLRSIILPKTITDIEDSAFWCSWTLCDVEIPSTVKRIGNHAFSWCYNLQELTIPESVEYIGIGAFADGTGIRLLTIPKSVKEIGGDAFMSMGYPDSSGYCYANLRICGSPYFKGNHNAFNTYGKIFIDDVSDWCNAMFEDSGSNPLSNTTEVYIDGNRLSDLIIPETVTKIENFVFTNHKKIIKSVTVESVTPPSIGDRTFSDYACPLYVPEESLMSYIMDDVWGNFITISKIDDSQIIPVYDDSLIRINGNSIEFNEPYNHVVIYDVNGRIVYKGLSETIKLQDGLYIIIYKDKCMKISI